MSQQQGQQTQNTSGGQPQQDYSKAWEEYFKRTGQHAQAAAVAQQTAQQSPAQQQQQQQQQQPATTKTEPGATNGGSQPDYSAQWAEYYRKLAEYQKANGGQQ